MNKNVIERIEENIKKVRVIDYDEKPLASDSKFVGVKIGTYKLNNGQTIIREGVTKKIGTGDAVCVFAVTTDKKVLMVIQPRVALNTENKVNVEIPAGYKEIGETAVEAGIRELTEETGYSSNNVILVDSYYPSPGASGEKIEVVLALDCVKVSEQKLDKDEFIFYEQVGLEEFEYLLNNNYILDAHARIGYYRYLEYTMKEQS